MRAYADLDQPGRLDTDGVEWWACDPYPTWFRWEGGELHTLPWGTRFVDQPPLSEEGHVKNPEDCYGSDNHRLDCDQIIRTKWSGVGCACGARWFCL